MIVTHLTIAADHLLACHDVPGPVVVVDMQWRTKGT